MQQPLHPAAPPSDSRDRPGPAVVPSPRQKLLETLTRSIAELTAYGDLDGVRALLPSLERLLGEGRAAAVGEADEAPANEDRGSGRGSR